MNVSDDNQNHSCNEIKQIEKMYSDQAVFTYSLMVFSVFAYSLLLVIVP